MTILNIAGKFNYYDRITESVSLVRAVRNGTGTIDKRETEVMRDLAAAIDMRDNLIKAVEDMRKLLAEGQV